VHDLFNTGFIRREVIRKILIFALEIDSINIAPKNRRTKAKLCEYKKRIEGKNCRFWKNSGKIAILKI
jgi:hypothetical protein